MIRAVADVFYTGTVIKLSLIVSDNCKTGNCTVTLSTHDSMTAKYSSLS